MTQLEDEIRRIVREEIASAHSSSEWVDQAASPLGRRQHCKLVRLGKLPGNRVGKRVLVRRSDLDRYIAKHPVKVRKTEPLPSAVDDAAVMARRLRDLGYVKKSA